jgi:hypothetical protein
MSSLISKYESLLLKNSKIIETIDSLGRFVILFTINPENETQSELGFFFHKN